MSSGKAALARRFNPKEYKTDALELMRSNPELAADAMTKLARTKNAAEGELSDGQEATMGIISGTLASVMMLGVGNWIGSDEEKAQAMITDWEMSGAASIGADIEQYPAPWDHPEGVKDPRKILKIIPKPLATTVGFAILAGAVGMIAKTGTDNFGYRLLRDAAFLNVGVFLANIGANMGRARARKKMEQAAIDEAAA